MTNAIASHQPTVARGAAGNATITLPPRARGPLQTLFSPRRVSVVGATDRLGSIGRALVENLRATPFGGSVVGINPKRTEILGLPCFPSLALAGEVDLAVIATPAASVPSVIADCAAARVRTAVIISAGFRECGPVGADLERQVVETAERGGVRLVGPNCLGVMSPVTGLNATFAAGMALPGSLAFISQSGAMGSAVLDWSRSEGIGFSAFVSTGAMADICWADFIDYFGVDPATRAILLYMESIGDARSFLSAARAVSPTKPIILIKGGRSEIAAKAALAHTGSVAGEDAALDACFRRAGILRVDSISDLFSIADILERQPRPRGRRLAIITNGGGPAVLAADAIVDGGGEVAALSPATMEALDRLLPAHWSHGDPVDVLGDADAARYAQAAAAVAADPDVDGLLAILAPQRMHDAAQTAEALASAVRASGKPVLASWMGGESMSRGREALHRAGIPSFAYPETAARAFTLLTRHARYVEALYATPELPPSEGPEAPDRATAGRVIAAARAARRSELNDAERKAVLEAYGIRCPHVLLAGSDRDAADCAERIGFPVDVRLHAGPSMAKDTGPRTGLTSASEVRAAFNALHDAATISRREAFLGVAVRTSVDREMVDLYLGSSCDPQLGPVVAVGCGGRWAEALADRVVGLPPLTMVDARHLLEETRIATIFASRGIDIDAVAAVLVWFSHLILEQPWIRECEIKPLALFDSRSVAIDARIVLHDAHLRFQDLPRPAIRPYPSQYVHAFHLADAGDLLIRPVRSEDEPAMIAFHQGLSERTVQLRYFHAIGLSQRIAHPRLAQICHADYERELPLVIEHRSTGRIIAVGRLNRNRGACDAELAIVVADAWQSRGLGTRLVQVLIAAAREEGYRRVVSFTLPDNPAMLALLRSFGFTTREAEGGVVSAQLDLA